MRTVFGCRAVGLIAHYARPVPTTEQHDDDFCSELLTSEKPLQKQTRLDPDQLQRMIADYQSGMTVRQVAVKWNMNGKTVSIQLRRASVVTRPAARKLKEDQIAAIVASYIDGTSMCALAKEHAVHPATIKSHLLRSGVELS